MFISEQWLSIYQTITVGEYCDHFISFEVPLSYLPKEVMLSNFIKRLEPRIQTEIRFLNPFNVEKAIEWAGRLEEKQLTIDGLLPHGPNPFPLSRRPHLLINLSLYKPIQHSGTHYRGSFLNCPYSNFKP